MRYIIIEDEQLAANRLRSLVEKLKPEYEFVTKFDSVESASISLPALSYDLLFMDIQLADGLSFDIFDQIDIKKPIIFTTAYDEFALKAFKTNSVDYLLKPISEEELGNAINKYETNFDKPKPKTIGGDLDSLMKALQPSGKERFVVKVGEHLKTVESKNVQLVYSQDKGTYLFTDAGKRFLVDYTLDKVEDLLNPSHFFRISRKFIININFIKDIIAFTNSRLEIVVDHFDEDQIIVARERVGDFKDWLDR
ncbi:two component transcriptional regulator, LytTR family [Ekhidna lutea]|uniref:Two component transcriptional regulator, LytTR family n=1 Tax=Ekhidna lutea TaxID=447679 RepID=A0A239H4I7_EKHLU|nr:LytTR family DNA-binding domain-containing protein [Ekhidna lutea]SNS76366.1 two component transcriptional regulator, LytTR family [Ekhidna lutea]